MAGVNVKMGVSGVAEFKRSMKESQTAVKTLDQELKKSEAQYKATGDKEKYMADQSKLLKQKLEEQKRTAKEAEKALDTMRKQGVEQTSTAYQEMSRQLAKAQTDIYNTQVAMNGLNASETQAAQNANTLGNNIAGISKKVSLQQVQSGLRNVDNLLKSAAGYAIQIGQNLYNGLTSAAGNADDLLTLSLQTGIDVETLQKMELAGKIFDTSVDTIVAARRKLNKGVQGESKDVDEALEALGIKKYILTAKDKGYLEKRVRDSQELFWEAGEKLMAETNADKRDKYAQALFGRNFDDLYPLFNAGEDAYKSFLDEQSAVSEENIKKLGALNDQLDTMNYQFEQAKTNLLAAFAPALEKVSSVVTNLLSEFNKYLETPEGQQKMQDLSDAVTSLFDGLENIDPEDVLNTAIGVIDSLKSALEWISNNWEGVVTGIKMIIGAWAAVKAAEGITTFLNLIDGIKGLGTGGAAAGAAAGSGWGSSFARAASAAISAVPWLAVALAAAVPMVKKVEEAGGIEQLASEIPGDAENALDVAKAWLGDTEAKLRVSNRNAEKVNEFMKESGIDQILNQSTGEKSTGEKYPDDPNSLYKSQIKKLDENLKILEENGIEIPAELTLQDKYKEAQRLVEELGTIQVPVELVPTSAMGATYWWGKRPVGGGGGAYYVEDAEQREGFANGLPFVPYEGYYHLHPGERVLTAGANRNYTYNSNTYFGNVNLNNGMEIDALSESIARQNRRHNAGYGT
jgi:hypothetical protein